MNTVSVCVCEGSSARSFQAPLWQVKAPFLRSALALEHFYDSDKMLDSHSAILSFINTLKMKRYQIVSLKEQYQRIPMPD